jgi:GT2 family glycosyltransferase
MLADVGLLDEEFFMYLEDVDLAFRAQLLGWGCFYEPRARVYHQGSATGGGPLASYYNGRNLIRLLAKDLPSGLVARVLPAVLRYQSRRARAALAAARGAAARATLRGQAAGLAGLPRHLAARPPIQRRRRVSDDVVYGLLSPETP